MDWKKSTNNLQHSKTKYLLIKPYLRSKESIMVILGNEPANIIADNAGAVRKLVLAMIWHPDAAHSFW